MNFIDRVEQMIFTGSREPERDEVVAQDILMELGPEGELVEVTGDDFEVRE